MTVLNISNPTGTKRNWQISVGDEVLVSGIKSWTEARDAGVAIAIQRGIEEVILHKINGTVVPVPVKRKKVSEMVMAPVAEGDVVYIARIAKNFDSEYENKGVTATLEAAIKTLPRKAHGLNWHVDPFDSHKLDDGRIVSIEKTTN